MPEVLIPSQAGKLEARYHKAETRGPIALILHTFPQFGGNMNTPMVYQTYYALVHRGYSVLRFNYRGVGLSEGTFDGGEAELQDANSALDWMHGAFPGHTGCTIVGFSFGAWVGANLMARRPEVDKFVAVTPPSNYYDFTFMAEFCPASALFISAENDAVVPKQCTDDLLYAVQTQNKQGRFSRIEIPGANHFFDNRISILVGTISDFIDGRVV